MHTQRQNTCKERSFLRKGLPYLQATVAIAVEMKHVKLLLSHILSVCSRQKLQRSHWEGKIPLIFLRMKYGLRATE